MPLPLALAILTLIVGVITMHSVGSGHQTMGMPAPGHAMTTAAFDERAAPMPVVVTEAFPAAAAQHGLTMLCLAVLPILLLVLSRAAGHWRSYSPGGRAGLGRSLPVYSRGPPRCLCPSLWKLCVLRT